MATSFVDITGAGFRTDKDSDNLNTEFMKRLGFQKRYLPARLAIARSIGQPSIPEVIEPGVDLGKVIKGDTLFGTDSSLLLWIAYIVQRSENPNMELRELQAVVGAHWGRGIKLLEEDWRLASGNTTEFYKRLLNTTNLSRRRTKGPRRSTTVSTGEHEASVIPISVPIGELAVDISTKEQVTWNLNGKGGSPHSAIMGGVGSGKTRTAVSMIKAIRQQANVPIIAFDFKGDLGTDSAGGGYHLDKLFDAQILEPPRAPIPLDVFAFLSEGEVSEIDIDEAASRFRESFKRLKGSNLGDVQRTTVHKAATNAFRENRPCQLNDIKQELSDIYDQEGIKQDGALATMEEICRFPLFQPKFDPRKFFQQSWIVKLPPNVAEDSRTIVVNLILDSLDQYLNSLNDSECNSDGTRRVRLLCIVDEAHQVLDTKQQSLSNLIRMSRSKGGAIMLISQSPDDFSNENDEFLAEMGLVAAFSTNAPPRHAQRVLGKGADLGALKTGQCYIKRREDQKARKIQAWE